MMNSKTKLRLAARGLFATCVLALGGHLFAASAQTASTSYRGSARDPFAKYRVIVRRKPEKKVPPPPVQVAPPSPQARIQQYKSQRQAAMNAQQPAPKPTTALLLRELQVIGIFRTPRGYAAMVEATPIRLSYVIYPGETFYDGQLVAIEESRLVFRRETLWSNGQREVTTETKPLRPANAVRDSLTMSAAASETQGEGQREAKAEGKPEEKSEEKSGADTLPLPDATKAFPSSGTTKGGGRAVPPPGGTGRPTYWQNRDKFDNLPCKKGVVNMVTGEVTCN